VPSTTPRSAVLRELGRQAYEPVWHAMQRFTDTRDDATADELWVVEHDPVFTLGQAGKPEHVLAAGAHQAVTVTRAGRLLANSKGTGAAVRSLEPGMMLYPTGVKEGVMWEVEDEMGNKGWVSSTMLELSK